MDSNNYLKKIQAKEMSRKELIRQIGMIYEDYASISKECDTLNTMLAKVKENKTNYEKEFEYELKIRKYANSEIYGHNMCRTRNDIELEGLCFLEENYIPLDYDRLLAEDCVKFDLLPVLQKAFASILCWFYDCVEYLRGIWGINKGY